MKIPKSIAGVYKRKNNNKKRRVKSMRKSQGITLIALVVTIIVLLILAGVTLSLVAGENGILKRATTAVEITNEAEAREKLEMVLAQLRIDKYSVDEYDEETYIDQEINKEGMSIVENVVIVDGWKFEIDRSKLQIVSSLGQGTENKSIEIATKVVSNETYTKATITYTISYNGILKSIQINGQKVDIPLSSNNEYKVEKEVDKNGSYNIYVIDENSGYKMGQAIVSELAEDIEIKTVEEFVKFRDKVNAGATYEGKKVTLKDNLDLSEVCSESLGSWVAIGDDGKRFEGNFEGNGKTISNVYLNNAKDVQGLFGTLGEAGKVSNLTVEGTFFSSGMYLGAVAGKNYGMIEKCNNKANISATHQPGGIVGGNGGILYRCVNNGTIQALGEAAGGIASLNGCFDEIGYILECINNGSVSSGSWVAGGIVAGNGSHGLSSRGFITNSYNTGSISGGVDRRAGIVGQVKCRGGISYVYNCYNRGNINGCPEIIGFDWGGETSYVTLNSYGTLEATVEKLNVESEIEELLKEINLYKAGVWKMKDGVIALEWE